MRRIAALVLSVLAIVALVLPWPRALATGLPDVLTAIAKSILQSADIEFLVRGEGVQDLLGWGRFPKGLNVAAGPMEIQVRAEDAPEARETLSGLQPHPISLTDDD